MIFFLILGALVLLAVVGLVVLWVYLDGQITHGGKALLKEVMARLENAENEVSVLKRRVEDLETIAANED